jgi:hypothetical protein
MQRTLINTMLGFGFVAASTVAFADGWNFLPVMDSGFKPNVTVSAVGGAMNGSATGAGAYTGIEAAFNCLAMQPPSGVIRTKASYGQFNQNGLKLTTFEINPRWTTEIAKDVTVGVGPGVGFVQADTGTQTNNMAALQVGADLDYRIGAMNLGLGARWQGTSNNDLGNGTSGANNTLIQAKVGMNF